MPRGAASPASLVSPPPGRTRRLDAPGVCGRLHSRLPRTHEDQAAGRPRAPPSGGLQDETAAHGPASAGCGWLTNKVVPGDPGNTRGRPHVNQTGPELRQHRCHRLCRSRVPAAPIRVSPAPPCVTREAVSDRPASGLSGNAGRPRAALRQDARGQRRGGGGVWEPSQQARTPTGKTPGYYFALKAALAVTTRGTE